MHFKAITGLTLTTGLALFAMFFGAGNLIFPLKLGASAGQHVLMSIFAFLISGVGVPFLGLFAVSLYEGEYWKFFERYGKVFAFIIVTFLVLIIGPLFAAPRTEIVTYHTLLPALPGILKNPYFFNFMYFSIVFLLICKQTRVVEIIGWFLSPVKIIVFATLIILSIYFAAPLLDNTFTGSTVFSNAFTMGYGTMDLLGAIFFCTVAYKHIVFKCKKIGIVAQKQIAKITLISCLIGALLVSLVYVGLILAAATHANELQNVPTEALIQKISLVVLGKYGALFVGICVSLACLATAAALTEVTTDYLYSVILKQRISRVYCMLSILLLMYLMAILGFEKIMSLAGPILTYLYPTLIILCLINIFLKFYKRNAFS